ncbi:hypothetical protein [Sphingopyxis fribergensis]
MTADINIIRFDAEIREWAVRSAAFACQEEDPDLAIARVALLTGCSAETLRRWMRSARRAGGIRPGVFTRSDIDDGEVETTNLHRPPISLTRPQNRR